jgi:diacylglycerol kinase (ATP)
MSVLSRQPGQRNDVTGNYYLREGCLLTATVILNPCAARGGAKRLWPKYREELIRQGVVFELVVSERRGHAILLAAEAARRGQSPIIAAGGDGTISEVINGLVSFQLPGNDHFGPVGIIPLGSSNDLAKTLHIPLDPAGSAAVIARGRGTLIDLGRVNDRFFVLNAAIALEAQAGRIQSGISWIAGPVRYKLASLLCILGARHWSARLTWDAGEYTGPLMLLTVGNAPRTGGFYVAPHADLRDGLLTCVYMPEKSRTDLLRILPKMLNGPGNGDYTEEPGVVEIHTPWLEVELEPASPAHADGEILPHVLTRLSFSVRKRCVEILV